MRVPLTGRHRKFVGGTGCRPEVRHGPFVSSPLSRGPPARAAGAGLPRSWCDQCTVVRRVADTSRTTIHTRSPRTHRRAARQRHRDHLRLEVHRHRPRRPPSPALTVTTSADHEGRPTPTNFRRRPLSPACRSRTGSPSARARVGTGCGARRECHGFQRGGVAGAGEPCRGGLKDSGGRPERVITDVDGGTPRVVPRSQPRVRDRRSRRPAAARSAQRTRRRCRPRRSDRRPGSGCRPAGGSTRLPARVRAAGRRRSRAGSPRTC